MNGIRQTLHFVNLLAILSLLSPISVAANWPGSRTPTLIERWDADLIAFVEVASEKRKGSKQVSRLKLISIIKDDGRPRKNGKVKAFVQLGSTWPYTFPEKGQKAIAFLSYDKEKERYESFQFNFGGFDVNDKIGKFLVKQYAKLPQLLKEKDPRKLLQKKVDWYFELASQHATREDMTYGLRMLWLKAKKDKLLDAQELVSESELLSLKQKQELCELISSEKELTFSAFYLIRLLQNHPSEKIDNYLLKAIRVSLESDYEVPYKGHRLSDLAIDFLPTRMGFEIPKSLTSKLEAYEEKRMDYAYDISIGDEFTKEEKQTAKNDLIASWRILAKEFLQIEELEKQMKQP